MSQELKPCPFCGGTDVLMHTAHDVFWAACVDCVCVGPGSLKQSEQQAADEWNRRAPTWQPIATAPKDGREVLLLVKVRAGIPGKCLVGHWQPGGHCVEDHPAIDAGWYFWTGRMFDLAAEPTHWAELPGVETAGAVSPSKLSVWTTSDGAAYLKCECGWHGAYIEDGSDLAAEILAAKHTCKPK